MPHWTHINLAEIENISDLQVALDLGAVSAVSILEMCQGRGLEFRAHPLGFISCAIFIEGHRKARLHIWPFWEGVSQGEGVAIHDHVFDFTSWVLSGEVINKLLYVDEGGRAHSVYDASYLGESSILIKRDENINIIEGGSFRFSAGGRYSMCAGQLHETKAVGAGITVTVLITNDVSSHSPLVIGPLSGPERYEYCRKVISSEELAEIISCLEVVL
ncbi:hypothetical protein PS925_04171 [Pseudomonas fluorescens]|uniref:Uncharacterized protein n=1 Tax=Pseudomonas fluorescens TaxID=294 RepID=A0A5E7V4X9_PSEFL|nr:hypothetical protein [Pseudomonas fluorescens]VVQ16598.1 hypothetical protein PS925_04171 [Pseudomonas fluorescens]